MSDHQIINIRKGDHTDPHEQIISIVGVEGGQRWEVSQQEAIAGIEAGRWRFYVHRDGSDVWVVVAATKTGHKYLKAESDGEQPNGLLALPARG